MLLGVMKVLLGVRKVLLGVRKGLTTICLYSPGSVLAGQLIEWDFTPTHS